MTILIIVLCFAFIGIYIMIRVPIEFVKGVANSINQEAKRQAQYQRTHYRKWTNNKGRLSEEDQKILNRRLQ